MLCWARMLTAAVWTAHNLIYSVRIMRNAFDKLVVGSKREGSSRTLLLCVLRGVEKHRAQMEDMFV